MKQQAAVLEIVNRSGTALADLTAGSNALERKPSLTQLRSRCSTCSALQFDNST